MNKNINVIEVLERKSNEAFRKSSNINSEAYLHDTQINTGRQIVTELSKRTTRGNYLNLIASPQMGKTGTCISAINILSQTKLDCILGIDKFMFITGMNDNGLKSQTQLRIRQQTIGASIDNIYVGKRSKKNLSPNKFYVLKNSDLLAFDEKINNTLIFIDESHYGSNERNVLTKFLELQGIDWKNTIDLVKRNIFIVSISATPFDELISDTVDCKKMVQIEKSNNYVGISEYLKNDLIFDASKDDICPDGKIFEYIKGAHNRMLENNNGVGAIFIRTRNFDVIENDPYVYSNFNVFEMYASGSSIQYDELNGYFDEMIRNNEYNKKAMLMNTASSVHSAITDELPLIDVKPLIILIKGAFRAGITIEREYKDYIYMVYDYSVKADTTAQALLGRMCGHRDLNNSTIDNTHFYINKKYADMYSDWENDFTNKEAIPCNKMIYEWIDNDETVKGSELGTKPCGNFEIPLTDEEIKSIYTNGISRKNRVEFMEYKLQEIFSSRNINNTPYDYIGEVVISGKNNYKLSSQEKRFNNFSYESTVFQFRPYKIKKFMKDTNRDYLTNEDLGKKCISVVLDAEIYGTTDNLVIEGNKRLLVYYVEVGQKIRVANRKGMYKEHKDTFLVKKKKNETVKIK